MDYAMGIVALNRPEWVAVESVLYQRPRPRQFLRTVGQSIADGHNSLIWAFLHAEPALDWLLLIDDDAAVHPRTAERLASWGQPLVSALNFSRPPSAHPGIFDANPDNPMRWKPALDETADWLTAHPALLAKPYALLDQRPADSLRPVDATGTHCILVHRRVLEGIEPPWFAPFPKAGSKKFSGRGSDFYFIIKAARAGFPPVVDRSVATGHASGRLVVGAYDFLAYYHGNAALAHLAGPAPRKD